MKYVMFTKRGKALTHHVPIIFPATMVHAQVAAAIAPLLEGFEVTSAGDVNANLGATCHGFSETLGLSADVERDSSVIAMNDYGGAFE